MAWRLLRPVGVLAAGLSGLLSLGATARAEGAPPPARAASPRAHHAPVSAARVHEDLRITVTFDHPELIREAEIVFRAPRGDLRVVGLLRSGSGGWVGVVPGEAVLSPGLAYAIEILHVDGRRLAAFASRDALHPVLVPEDHADARERATLARLDGRRSVVTTMGEVVRFGTTSAKVAIPCGAGQSECRAGELYRPTVDDQYWRLEAGYTYRPLRTVAEFGLRIGVVRGTSLVSLAAHDASKYKVGLNYASPSVRFRLADAWHVDLSLVTSVTEIGFSVGGGGALLIGDPLGSRLTLGAEAVGLTAATYFGSRFFAKLDLPIHPRVTVAPALEITDMPHAEAFGVRLYGDVTANLGRGFSIGARGGYQARRSTSGGVGLGGSVSYAF